MACGTRRMARRTGPGISRRIWATSRSKRRRSMPSSSSFSSSTSLRDAVEEQVDGQDDDDEVVEAADHRDVVRDQVAPAGRGSRARRPAGPCGPSASARRASERPDEPGVDRGPAGHRQERGHARARGPAPEPEPPPRPVARVRAIPAASSRAMRSGGLAGSPVRDSAVYQRRPTRQTMATVARRDRPTVPPEPR